MKTSQILKATKALIADPNHYIGGGRDPCGLALPAEEFDNQGKICRRCMMGAFWGFDPPSRATTLVWKTATNLFGESPIWVNDVLGYDAAHIILDEAIAAARKAGD